MVSTDNSVFIVGPGFIGWNVLDLLVAGGFQVTGFVRREEHANQIQASGASAVIGDLDDEDAITAQTFNHGIVFHTATADHLASVKAIIRGIKNRAAQGLQTIFIHTSGTSVLDDKAEGAFKSDKVYHDTTRFEIDSVPDNAPHRQIDLAIVQAQEELGEMAKIAIMIPPTIYGFNPNHGRLTIQIPTLTRFALKHGYAGHLGKGLAVESNIHVLDLARAYLVLLKHLQASHASSLLANPYYFCEATGDEEPSWLDIAGLIGKALQEAGKIEEAKPRQIPESMYHDLFGNFTGAVVGLNSRSRAVRLRELGWRPQEKNWKDSFLQDELPKILEESTKDFAGYKGVAAS